jgi:uncharacterized protein (DUF433 family)
MDFLGLINDNELITIRPRRYLLLHLEKISYFYIMVSHLDRITAIPGLCNGKPTIRGKRLTVHTLLSHLAAGETEAEIFESFPFLEKEDITAALEYAALMADHINIRLSNKQIA